VHAGYADRPDATGNAYLSPDRIAAHLAACTEAGVQAGFHAIGDAAVDAVVAGARQAAARHGAAAVRALRHRVEHAELVGEDALSGFSELGLVASVQPAFDAAWGGPDGMYVRRLGAERAARMNPFASLNRAGVPLAFGSDAPVTPLDPWGTVRAAAFHHTPEQRISVRAGFNAHTRGGHRALGRDDEGVLVPGAPATYAVWRTGELTVQAPDRRLSAWSTDPSSGTPGLPDLTPGEELPQCVRTVVRGTTVYAGEED
jgi:predicted amidohydrolase YtcJ